MVGTVFQARDVDLDRVVAVKVWREDTAVFNDHYLPRLRIAANLRHPAVARLHDIRAAAHPPYVVTAYLPHPFTTRLPDSGAPLPPEKWPQLLLLLAQAADVLSAAHQRGLLHGHLKPTNLHLKPNPTAEDTPPDLVVTDFGLTPRQMRDVRSRPYLETLHYCAPEQLDGAANGRSDIYSLGVILYRLAAGRLPYTANTLEEARRRHRTSPPRLTTLAPDTPPALANLIRQAMAPEPEHRFPDAAALAAALRRLATGPGLGRASAQSKQNAAARRQPASAGDAPPLIGDVRLALTPPALTINPGDSGEMRAELHNQGARVAQFNLKLEGWPEEWSTLSPGTIRLLPEARQTAVIRFHPPRTSNATAGTHAVTLVAQEPGRPEARQGTSATVQLTPFTDLDAALHPKQIRNGGACRLTLLNNGNVPLDFHVAGRDPAEALRFGGDGQRGHLSPGEETAVSLTIVPRAPRPWLGRRQTLPFRLNVTTDQTGEPLVVNGQLEVRPRIPPWLPVLLTTLITVICVALGFFLALN